MQKQPKTTNIRSKNGSNQTVRLDLLAKEEIKHIREYFLRACNHNPTTTVLVRRSIDFYCQFIDGLPDLEDELDVLMERAMGDDVVELTQIGPLDKWQSFNDRLLEDISASFKDIEQ